MTDAPASIAADLRREITRSGLTYYRIGIMAQVDPSMVSRFARGERGLTTKTLDALASALGLRLVPAQEQRGTTDAVSSGRAVEAGAVQPEEQGINRVPVDSVPDLGAIATRLKSLLEAELARRCGETSPATEDRRPNSGDVAAAVGLPAEARTA
jgi:hypothetical protein